MATSDLKSLLTRKQLASEFVVSSLECRWCSQRLACRGSKNPNILSRSSAGRANRDDSAWDEAILSSNALSDDGRIKSASVDVRDECGERV